MNPTAIVAAIGIAVAASIGFASAWQIRGAQITEINLGHANERIEQQRAARATSERLAQQVITAQNAAAARNTSIAADSRRAGDAGNGLRSTSATAVRASTDDSDACGATVAAYGVILDESISFIREVSSAADQCISDSKALTDAWPR